MNIQSLHITIPTDNCINNCKFCCSKQHTNPYKYPGYVDYKLNVFDRLKYATNKGCDTMILTSSNGEVLQNKGILDVVLNENLKLNNPLINIELQTTGVLLDDVNLSYLKQMGIKTISLSVSNLFCDLENTKICGILPQNKFYLDYLCRSIKSYGFNLRLSLLMTNYYDNIDIKDIFDRAKSLGTNQLTFKKLYYDGDNKISKWIQDNACKEETLDDIKSWIIKNGRKLETLPFGFRKYSYNGISVVIDDNCMVVGDVDIIRYYIIREDGKLYTKWDDTGSLIF